MVYHKTEKVLTKHQNLRKKILQAAKQIFAEEEKEQTSIKAIAKRAGIATGTVYLYFTNKEVLMETIVKELYTELLDIIQKERAKYGNTFDKLQASMEICVKKFMEEKHLAKILLEHFPEIGAAFHTKFTDIENDLIQFAKQDIDELMLQGLIPRQDTQVSATAFVGTFRQVIFSWISHGEPEEFEQAYQTLIKYNMRGLGKGLMTHRLTHKITDGEQNAKNKSQKGCACKCGVETDSFFCQDILDPWDQQGKRKPG
ncbi:MAG: putative HTH-type transcriptional regulator YvdT [Candidatus Dichloromethanomonas elyunquensis]|nr:MAG: putative HTH-type transcriptional regulator YvdT [Candidatus Dichloromethanomonas elyunquensis]